MSLVKSNSNSYFARQIKTKVYSSKLLGAIKPGIHPNTKFAYYGVGLLPRLVEQVF
jgi:hypothetical protein